MVSDTLRFLLANMFLALLDCRYQLPPEQRALLLKMFDRAFDCCCTELVESHKALLTLDRDNARAYATK
jgi:hypothetical protein